MLAVELMVISGPIESYLLKVLYLLYTWNKTAKYLVELFASLG
jgi:hypothetical protein